MTEEVHACGKGAEGQLGIDDQYIGYSQPLPVTSLRRIVKISGGTSHCLALTDHGTVFAWGSGADYKLGTLNRHDQPIPVQLPFDIPMIDIAVGENHSVAIDEKGYVHTWGSGREGQLGYAAKDDKSPKCLNSDYFDGNIMSKCFANSCYTYVLR
jgi:hypothetical protein